MTPPSSPDAPTTEVVDALADLTDLLGEWGTKKVMLIVGPSRRFVDRISLGDIEVHVFDGAEVHVPEATVEAAREALDQCEADTLVSLGGGAATGLGKALRLEREVRFVAVPTTYSGSEMTGIWGTTRDGDKRTGRDERVRPDAVVRELSLFRDMPKKLTITSLMNAMAHPVSALSTGALEFGDRANAFSAIESLSWAVTLLVDDPRSSEGRRAAFEGAALAGSIIDRGAFGRHHKLAHLLGGRFGLDHAALHAVLLPHTLHRLVGEDRSLYDAICAVAREPDLPARLYDALTRTGAPRSLVDLGVDLEALDALGEDFEVVREPWALDARSGHRPSVHVRRERHAASLDTSLRGPALANAERVLICFHGRGSNAGRALEDALALTGNDPATCIVAPQARDNRWYSRSYRATTRDHGAELEDALEAGRDAITAALAFVPEERVFLAGFSQGACLAAELFARSKADLGGLVALSGARIGPRSAQAAIGRKLVGSRVVLGVSRHDPWVDVDDVEGTAAQFREAGADVAVALSPSRVHEVTFRQRVLAREALFAADLRRGAPAFGNFRESEALPGALPLHQNSPNPAPYGLYAEQINGTGFAVGRHDNQRTWFYRIRPAAQHSEFLPLDHATLVADWDTVGPDANLIAHAPLPSPGTDTETDFVDGLHTYGGSGHPSSRRGFAIHLYAANASMEHRSFYDADGDLLIVPQEGALTVITELGALDLAPGQVMVVPRGLQFSVVLVGSFARGWVGEVYGRHFDLPERGPIGANGVADARHFRSPSAYFENRIDPGFRITAKLGNQLFEATQDYVPYDVVAWHGNYAPHVYDLADFSPVSNVRVDHPDPSLYVVLTAALDEAGSNTLDFVFFPPRWDATEHTFRPPFFHRNATSEINGIIGDPQLNPSGPFTPGLTFVTPPMTAHGALARSVESALARTGAAANRPSRTPDDSRWFQFESALPIGLTSWARDSPTRIRDWPGVWGSDRTRFSVD